jgi:hypothetical protein
LIGTVSVLAVPHAGQVMVEWTIGPAETLSLGTANRR